MDELKGMVGRVGADAKQRKVWEVLDSAAGAPPLPLKSAYSSRSPSSRQVRPHCSNSCSLAGPHTFPPPPPPPSCKMLSKMLFNV